jgi:hypothetical protein
MLPFHIKQLCKDARFCSTSHYRNDLLIVKQICKATALQLQYEQGTSELKFIQKQYLSWQHLPTYSKGSETVDNLPSV